MSDRMLLATRKGLLQFERGNGAWRIARTHFPGVAVTAALADARDGTLYAMLKHGHFGKMIDSKTSLRVNRCETALKSGPIRSPFPLYR